MRRFQFRWDLCFVFFTIFGSVKLQVMDWNEMATITHHDASSHHEVATLSEFLVLSDEVLHAKAVGMPLVALESTIITHGMPYPQNLDTAIQVEKIIRQMGAIPATVAILHGKIHVGLSPEDMKYLAQEGLKAKKTSRRDIAAVISNPNLLGATTVASTSLIAAMAGISIFVTGGIGGVHRGGEITMDISADLRELGRTPVAVVCAGAKSILDIQRTLEYLETEGVNVIGYKTDEFPAFFTRKSGFKVNTVANSSAHAASMIHIQSKLNLQTGMVIGNPVNPQDEAEFSTIEEATQKALKEATEKGIHGAEITPFLLKRINEISGGASLKANIALVKNNAKVGASIAVELAKLQHGYEPQATTSFARKQGIVQSNVVVIGGMVVDLIAKPISGQLIPKTSNPGFVEHHFGGVGRNIAEALARLRKPPFMISAVGNDANAKLLLENSAVLDINTFGVFTSEKNTATYLAILEQSGDLHVAIADMGVFDEISADLVAKHLEQLKKAEIVVLDGNVPVSTLKYVLEHAKSVGYEVWFEPTSVAKSSKIADPELLSLLTYISPNVHEVVAITNLLQPTLKDKKSVGLRERVKILLSYGVKHVILKRGEKGVLLGTTLKCPDCTSTERAVDGSDTFYFKEYDALPVFEVVNVTGAGDSLVGACIWSLLRGNSISKSIHFGLIAAKLSVESKNAVSEHLSEELMINSEPAVDIATFSTY